MSAPAPAEIYAFDNDDTESANRHEYLAAILDDFTRARLHQARDLAGAHCLEIGAGGGSIAQWLAGQVGPTGRVVATDLNPRYLPSDQGYTVIQHDLVNDPVPEGPWDLIHARLVLCHLPKRREVLQRLVAALAPGGAVVLHEWDNSVGNWGLAAPDAESDALLSEFQVAVGRALRAHGMRPEWSREMHAAMLAEGLVDVDTEVHARAWAGGTPGTLLLGVTLAQLWDELLADGFTREQLQQVRKLLHDPRLAWRGLLTYSSIGRKPA